MSTAFSRIIPAGRSHPSGRFRTAVDRINRFASDPNSSGSIVNAVGAHDDPKDLVALLINRNLKDYQTMLNNPFCEKMKTADNDDTKMKTGFKNYMIQDFFYLANQMVLDTERINKAKDDRQFNDMIGEVKHNADSASYALNDYTTKMKISSTDIFKAEKTTALKDYLEAERIAGKDNSYIEALVIMIPCIKGWYDIAEKLKTSAKHKDTDWYKFFIEPNADPQWSIALSGSFAVAYDDWKDDLKTEPGKGKLDKLFQKACQCEVDLFKVGDVQ